MNNLNTNPIIKRIVVKAEMSLATPALIGSGDDEYTDSDVLRVDGMPFLPGTSLAGVLRSKLHTASEEDETALFGSMQNGGEMSALWVYDTPLAGDFVILDGVALDYENKTAIEKKKFDYEAVAAESTGTIRLMLVIRENDDPSKLESSMSQLLYDLMKGNISVGAKANRGFGRISCQSINLKSFDLHPGNVKELERWEYFSWSDSEGWGSFDGKTGLEGNSILTAHLRLNGSIMIRSTNDLNGDEDYKHISMGGQAVIYGTSWAGAFRGGLFGLLRPKLGSKDETEAYLERYFGYVHEDETESQTTPSKILFDASVFSEETKSSGYRQISRVKIDRFTGGAANGALFTERPWFGGTTTLTVRFPKDDEDIKKLLVLALDAMDKKILTVGGETSVGRGAFDVLSVDVDGVPIEKFAKGR